MSVEQQGALKIVLCWHMHQPHYIDPESQNYLLPWTYLHAIKDYVDMAWYLEQTPGAKAVVNFTPTLLEQLDDYAQSIKSCIGFGTHKALVRSEHIKDDLLKALALRHIPKGQYRVQLIYACLKANQERLIDRYEPYKKLARLGRWLLKKPEICDYIEEQYFFDLASWYHIAWMGETVKLSNPVLKSLSSKIDSFDMRQRIALLKLVGDLIRSIVPRYKKLHQLGQVELSVTPYAHPIGPLMLDLNTAKEAWPEVVLPKEHFYPQGEQRLQWHIDQGIEVFKKHFGFMPAGCWPAEGGVSEQSLQQISRAGFKWVATGENVLNNSLAHADNQPVAKEYNVHRFYTFTDGLNCFFRDDGLSDEIGFNYSDWHADDAVANFIHHLENIREAQHNNKNALVAIILDGENAWEYYPRNGYYFLSALYRRLAEHPLLELTTFSECLDQQMQGLPLRRLVAGSWVYGTFSTWIGNPDKNKAWEILFKAKHKLNEVRQYKSFSKAQWEEIEKQLAICEGSDWFWWFGDDNPSESVKDFDMLYRQQVRYLYILMGEAPAEELSIPISQGGHQAVATGGVMRPGKLESTGG